MLPRLPKRALWWAFAGVLVAAGLASQTRVAAPPRSAGTAADLRTLRERDDLNVVLILVDTLRADHLSAYGYERPTTPFLEEVARYGIRFARARSQSSWTKTSMASLWTGRYPARTAVFDHSHVIPESLPMAAQAFHAGGFRTAGIYRNGWLLPNAGFGRGFEIYLQPVPSVARANFQQASRPGQHELQGTDLDVVDAALEFFRNHPRERSFVYLHLMDAHQYLYESESGRFGTKLMDSYDNAIHWTDRLLSAFFKGLLDQDLLRRTLIVIASDHGEEFMEHGSEGHARNLYREVTNVPLVISPPFNLERPIVVEERVRNIDVVPTLLDLAGLPPIPGADGISLLPLIEAVAAGRPAGDSAPQRDFALLDRAWPDLDTPHELTQSITARGLRLIVEDCVEDGVALFELGADPDETRNVAVDHPEEVAALRAEIDAHFSAATGETSTTEIVLDRAQIERLRKLGYVLGAPRPGGEPPPSRCMPAPRGVAGVAPPHP